MKTAQQFASMSEKEIDQFIKEIHELNFTQALALFENLAQLTGAVKHKYFNVS